jgi:hypothetical protein
MTASTPCCKKPAQLVCFKSNRAGRWRILNLAQRDDPNLVNYPGDAVRNVLERTLGMPIFHEQVMSLTIVAAGFTPGEANHLGAAWQPGGAKVA